jgi:hypothetical protein
VYLDEVIIDDKGGAMFVCSDTDYCERALAAADRSTPATGGVATDAGVRSGVGSGASVCDGFDV